MVGAGQEGSCEEAPNPAGAARDLPFGFHAFDITVADMNRAVNRAAQSVKS